MIKYQHHILAAALIGILLNIIGINRVKSQPTVTARIDSSCIFVGQQIGLKLEVAHVSGETRIDFPQFDSLQEIIQGVEFIYATPIDTDKTNLDTKFIRTYFITSFDTAIYTIPPMQIKINGVSYETTKMPLKVCSFPIDTANISKIYPIKSQMYPPFLWDEWKNPIYISLVVLLLTIVLFYILIKLKDKKPLIHYIKYKQRLAPHKTALKEIEKLQTEKLDKDSNSKEYYTRLTETLRQYINQRYGFNSMEMTTTEIIKCLHDVNDTNAILTLKELFETADLVKFAKHNTPISENDRNLTTAIEYIKLTKKEDLPLQHHPETLSYEDEQTQKSKQILLFISISEFVFILLLYIFVLYKTIGLNF